MARSHPVRVHPSCPQPRPQPPVLITLCCRLRSQHNHCAWLWPPTPQPLPQQLLLPPLQPPPQHLLPYLPTTLPPLLPQPQQRLIYFPQTHLRNHLPYPCHHRPHLCHIYLTPLSHNSLHYVPPTYHPPLSNINPCTPLTPMVVSTPGGLHTLPKRAHPQSAQLPLPSTAALTPLTGLFYA